MSLKLNMELARSLSTARWKQTLVAGIGVTFSVGMFIGLLAFMTGLNKLFDDMILNRTAHVRLYNELEKNPQQPITVPDLYRNSYHFISSVKASTSREEIYNGTAIMQSLLKDNKVQGIAPKIHTAAFFSRGNVRISGVIDGIAVENENRLFHFYDYVSHGSGPDLAIVPNSIILGKPLGEQLLAEIGDLIYVTTPSGQVFPLKLVGYYQSGFRDLDKIQGYTSILTAQKILGKSANYITDLNLRLYKIDEAPVLSKEYSKLYGVHALDIQTANREFESGKSVRNMLTYVVGITLLIVSGFGIYNILNMLIYEKMESIAILKATGFSGADVKKIFLLIAMSIGFFGGFAALVLGYCLSLLIHTIPFEFPSIPNITTYPVNNDPLFYVIGISFSLLTTYLAGIFPARKASKVDPIVIIRGK